MNQLKSLTNPEKPSFVFDIGGSTDELTVAEAHRLGLLVHIQNRRVSDLAGRDELVAGIFESYGADYLIIGDALDPVTGSATGLRGREGFYVTETAYREALAPLFQII